MILYMADVMVVKNHVFTHRIHWTIVYLPTNLPNKNRLNAGKYIVHGSYGFMFIPNIANTNNPN